MTHLRHNTLALTVLAALSLGASLPAPASPTPAPVPGPDPSPSPSPDPSPTPEPGPAHAEFSSGFISASSQVDLTRFERGNPVLPGEYSVDVYVNQMRIGRERVSFQATPSAHRARPCFTAEQLERLGVDTDALATSGASLAGCVELPSVVAGASVAYDSGRLRLDLSIPQARLRHRARGYVSPDLWDEGITAFTLGYSFNTYRSTVVGAGDSAGAYVGINAGLNLAGWRLRQQSSHQWQESIGSTWRNISTYAQHDVTRWRAQLTLGESFTSGELFDSTGFRGVSVVSDDRMLPDSMSGYAPTVRGVAETNARVRIQQNGYTIYETSVSPGAFEINDLYATGYGGDLEVSVIEADGRVRIFTVPYAAVPRLVRPGVWRYAATAGRLRDDLLIDAPYFAEATLQSGINNWLTGYGGLQTTQGNLYRALMAGVAFNTPAGAFALDGTYSSANVPRAGASRTSGAADGSSVRLSYNKRLESVGTNLSMGVYRYSSRNFMSLSDAAHIVDGMHRGEAWLSGVYERNSLQMTISQDLGEHGGSLYVTGTRYDYWDTEQVDASYQLGYSNRYHDRFSYSLNLGRTRNIAGDYDNQAYFNLTVPLGRSDTRYKAPSLTVSPRHGQDGNSVTTSVSGIAGAHGEFGYNANLYADEDDRATVGIGGTYRAPYAMLGANYSHSQDVRQLAFNGSGGVVIHRGGITLAQTLGDTMVLVEAKGAKGAHINYSNAKVDGRGYGVTNSLRPYRINDVLIDPKGISMDVELGTTRLQAVPRAGAIVALQYDTHVGRSMLVRARAEDGAALPFGAQVLDISGKEVGVVGQAGQIFVRGLEQGDGLTVRWGDMQSQQCAIEHVAQAGAGRSMSGIPVVEGVCHAGNASANATDVRDSVRVPASGTNN